MIRQATFTSLCLFRQLATAKAIGIRCLTGRALVYDSHGDPKDVVKVREVSITSPPTGRQLLLEMIAAPINPSDINQIEGVYPKRPPIPGAIGGNECLARVLEVGPEIRGDEFQVGDHVIPQRSCFGTWRTHAIAENADDLVKVSPKLNAIQASTMGVNVFSAYRLLKDFNHNGAIVQNAAGGGVGRAVIQLCKLWGIKSVNIVRDRPNLKALADELTELGADMVVTQESLSDKSVRESIQKKCGPISLALNCVGGKAAIEMCRLLANHGTMVTYGAMSRQAVPVPASLQIFKDITLKGFWMAQWKDDHSDEEYGQMLREVQPMYSKGVMREPKVELIKWQADMTNEELHTAFLGALYGSGKKVLVMSPSSKL